MKQIIQRLWMIASSLLIFLNASAYDFEVDGIQYRINSMTDRTCTIEKVTDLAGSVVKISQKVTYRDREFDIIGLDAGCLSPTVTSIDIRELNLSSLPEDAFRESNLTDVHLPSTLTSTGIGVFRWCKSLKSVELPLQLESIDASAFYGCTALQSVELPLQLKSIGQSGFYRCASLKEIKLPLLLEAIDASAFYGCTSLEEIKIPPYVKNIGYDAFTGCSAFKKIILEGTEDSPKIGLYAISLNNGLYSFPRNVENIEINRDINVKFNSNDNFTTIFGTPKVLKIGQFVTTLPDRTINMRDYDGLKVQELYILDRKTCLNLSNYFSFALEYLYLGGNVEGFHVYTRKVDFGENVTSLPAKFFLGSTFKSVILPQSIESIGDGCFKNCNYLKSIKLPDQLSSVGNSCFAECKSLKTITIGKWVSNIGANAFENVELQDIVCLAATPPVANASAFTNKTYMDATLAVSDESLSSYRDDATWGNFFDIKGLSPVIGMQFVPSSISLEKGTSDQLELTYQPKDPNGYPLVDFDLIWESSNPQIAQISSSGEVTAIEPGDCIVSVHSSSDPSLSSNCNVRVTPEIPNPFVVDGIKYNKIGGYDVEVIANDYSGSIAIPNSVDYNGVELSVVGIDKDAFSKCKDLRSLVIPGSIDALADNLLTGCTSLTTLVINESDKPLSLGHNTDLNLGDIIPFPNPSTVDERRTGFRNGYYNGLFYGLPIEHLVINRNIELPKYYERTRGNATSKYETVWNDIIYFPPFSQLSKLKSVEIGEKVTAICCNRNNVVVSGQSTEMDYMNFWKCNNIEVVVSNSPVASVGGWFEQTVYENAPLFLPNGGDASYKADTYWKKFTDIRSAQYVPVSAISFEKSELIMDVDDSMKLSPIFNPDNASIKKLKWVSSAPSIVEVSDDGEIKTYSNEGNVTVTAYACDGSGVSASITVSVKKGAATDDVYADSEIGIKIVDGIIYLDGVSNHSTVEIYDLQGQLIKSSHENIIDIDARGVFFLKIGSLVHKVIL